MKLELQSAANFLVHLARPGLTITRSQMEKFREELVTIMRAQYRDCWYPENPKRLAGVRRIRFDGRISHLVVLAGEQAGLRPTQLAAAFPSSLELGVDVDPGTVRYCFGAAGVEIVLWSAETCVDGQPWRAPEPSPQRRSRGRVRNILQSMLQNMRPASSRSEVRESEEEENRPHRPPLTSREGILDFLSQAERPPPLEHTPYPYFPVSRVVSRILSEQRLAAAAAAEELPPSYSSLFGEADD